MMSGCLDRKEVRGAIWGVHSTTDRPASGNTGRLFLAFGGPVCTDQISNCPLDRVLTYKNLIYLLNLQFHLEIYLLCYIHIMASPGFKRGIIQLFIASFEDFLCTCRREEIVGERLCVVPAAFLLLNRTLYLPRLTLHLILHCRVTLRACRREEIRRKEECIV